MIINCPHCGEALELPGEIEVGQRVLCPYCDQKFAIGDEPSVIVAKKVEETPQAEPAKPKSGFTAKEIDTLIAAAEKSRNDKKSPWTRPIKGNVWVKAFQMILLFGTFIVVREFVKGKMPNLLNGKDYVAEVVLSEINAFREHNEMHAARMKDYSLDFVITPDKEGNYPYLWAEKEPERVWHCLKMGISYMEDHRDWFANYEPKGHWDDNRPQARYERFNESREEIFGKCIEFFDAQLKMARATRKVFATYYLGNPNIVESTKREIMRLYPNGLKDIDTYLNEYSTAFQECGAAEESYKTFLANFKWRFDKIDGKK